MIKEPFLKIQDDADIDKLFYNLEIDQPKTQHQFRELLGIIGLPLSVGVEYNYVDRHYSDSYYMYFSGQHYNRQRFCKRIAIFTNPELTHLELIDSANWNSVQDSFIGTIVLRPLSINPIGRTLLDVSKFRSYYYKRIYTRMKEFSNTFMGVKLTVNAFPYNTQDSETCKCAENAILCLLDYYSQSYQEYKLLLPSEIFEIKKEHMNERAIPSEGMSFPLVTKVFSKIGFYPKVYQYNLLKYNGADMTREKIMGRFLYYYIESGIPAVLEITSKAKVGQSSHTLIAIGHSDKKNDSVVEDIIINNDGKRINIINTADYYSSYIVMDDSSVPYSLKHVSEFAEGYNLDTIMVPLYKKMYIEALSAEDIIIHKILADTEFGIRANFKGADDENPNWDKERIIIRLFMTTGRNYKTHKMSALDSDNEGHKLFYLNVPYPRFIWVCELSLERDYHDQATENDVIGEIIIDATANSEATIESIISIRYGKFYTYRNPYDEVSTLTDKVLEEWQLEDESYKHKAFGGNLVNSSYNI